MNWTVHTHVNLTSFEISSNIQVVNAVNSWYKQQKAFLKFKRLNFDVGGSDEIYVNGSKFTLYGAINDEYFIELTHYIGSVTGSSTIEVQNFMSDTVLSLAFTALDGLARTRVINDCMPSTIPILEGSQLPFYVQFYNKCGWLHTPTAGGNFVTIGSNGVINSVDIQTDINGGQYTYLIKLMNGTFSNTFGLTFNQAGNDDARDVILQPIDCDRDVLLVEWVGKFGELKSWWFEVDKTISEGTKQLDMATMDEGFSILKNKQISVLLTAKQCDIYNQTYLSDLVISDNVSIYDGTSTATKVQVKVAQSNFEVEKKRKDISMIINVLRYDFI